MPEPSIEGLERDIEEGRTFLTGEQQARVEVLTGKRLQAGAENFKAAREKRMAERPSAKPVPGEGDAPSDRPQPTKEARP